MAIKRILDKVEKQKQLLDGFWVHPFFNPLPSTILWSQIINGLISTHFAHNSTLFGMGVEGVREFINITF